MTPPRPRVAVIGAGPAGLVAAIALHRAGVDCVVFERRSRAHVEGRARAGFLEHRTVAYLRRHGLADRLDREAARHTRCEFRRPDTRITLEYGELAGGVAHFVYPQQYLVRDLIAVFVAEGGTIRFDHEIVTISDPAASRPVLTGRSAEGTAEAETFDLIAGCDGDRGVARAAAPAGTWHTTTRRYPFDWLTVLAEVPSAGDRVVYALHEDGFAGQMPRTATVARFYLQCPAGTSLADWPPARVERELRRRLASADAEPPSLVRVLETDVLTMRAKVTEPMRYGALFLAGDAAHIITPVGAKGMNLAIADAAHLADAMIASLTRGDGRPLAGYSDARLREVWRAQAFSDSMSRLIHPPSPNIDPAAHDGEFERRVWSARLDDLRRSGEAAVAFSRDYVGVRDDGPAPGPATGSAPHAHTGIRAYVPVPGGPALEQPVPDDLR